jgi:hypothetical protein
MVRSGRGFDGGQGQDFADFLRRELHAAADQVEPGADGLERIRDKIRSRPAHASQPKGILGVLIAIWAALARLIRRLGHPARRNDAPGPRRPRDWREAMLRPAFAIGTAVFAIGVVLSVVPPARSALVQVSDAIGSAFNISSSSSSAAGVAEGQGTRSLAPSATEGASSTYPAVGAPHSLTACPSPSAHPSVKQTKNSSPPSTTGTTSAPATSPSGSASSTASGSPSPSGSGGASPSGGTSPSAGVSSSDSPGGAPTTTHPTSPSTGTSSSASSSGSAKKKDPSAPCPSSATTHAQASTASTKPASKPTKSPSSSASASASTSGSTPGSSSSSSSTTGSNDVIQGGSPGGESPIGAGSVSSPAP